MSVPYAQQWLRSKRDDDLSVAVSRPHTRHILDSYARDGGRDDAASGDGLGKLLKDLGA